MTEETKESKSSDEHINLKVLGQDNNVVQFKIKKGTPLRKLMNAYCARCNLSMVTVRFRFDGQPINEQDTPASLEMEEGDTIEIYQQQTGGHLTRLSPSCCSDQRSTPPGQRHPSHRPRSSCSEERQHLFLVLSNSHVPLLCCSV